MISLPPITLAQVPPDWIALRREILAREGRVVRAGEGNTIEAKSTRTLGVIEDRPVESNEWFYITLPTGAFAFQHTLERDAVLHALTQP